MLSHANSLKFIIVLLFGIKIWMKNFEKIDDLTLLWDVSLDMDWYFGY